MDNNQDFFFLREAYRVALQSNDQSTQNGCVLVCPDSGTIVAAGANVFPVGVKETPDRWERPAKYLWVEHAERNSIYDAVKRGVKTEGLIMFGCWVACTDCARAIIQSGIREVVTHHDPTASTRFGMPASPAWLESIKVAMQMFDEAGVKLRVLDVPLFEGQDFPIRFNGKVITP